MAGPIKISTQEVRSTATRVRTLNGSLNDRLKEIQSQMTSLKSSWQSEGSEAIQSKFQAAANKYFSEYQKVVESYSKFLEQAVAEGYETTETAITGNANAFK